MPTQPGQSDFHVAPGEILREWREENGITQKMVSKLTGGLEHDGFSVEDIERIESGEIRLSEGDCERLARTGISAAFWRALELNHSGELSS
jgi:transcriptional regulator with XRE-family HTH domain